MQLIYGISSKINNLINEDIFDIVFGDYINKCGGYVLSSKNLDLFITYLNHKLEEKKDVYVKEIFGKEIFVEKIYLEADIEENIEYVMYIIDSDTINKYPLESYVDQSLMKFIPDEIGESIILLLNVHDKKEKAIISRALSIMSRKHGGYIRRLFPFLEKNSLFLPASRNGLMLLYRDFFCE